MAGRVVEQPERSESRKHAEDSLRRLNRELRAITDCNEALMRAVEEPVLLNDICRIVCEDAGYRLVWVGYAEHDDYKSVRPAGWAGVEDGYLKHAGITWADTERGRGPAGTAIRTGRTVYVQDMATSPEFAPWRESALQRGYRSMIGLPLTGADGTVFGVLAIYSAEVNAFTRDEIHLLEELAADLAFGINVLRARAELKRADQERIEHLWFFESMDRINRAIQGTDDLEQMMRDVLDTTLSIFNCDRAWLVSPLDPDAPRWRVPMERTVPAFPGAFAVGVEMAMGPEIQRVLRTIRASTEPVVFGPGTEQPLPRETAAQFSIQSQIAVGLHPGGIGESYVFGLHHCCSPHVWSSEEVRLFQAIGRRLSDALSTLLIHRDLLESESRLAEAQSIAHVGYWEYDVNTGSVIWSDETWRINGLSPQPGPLTREGVMQLIHPEDRDASLQALANLLESGSQYELEHRVIRPDGEVRFVKVKGNLKRDENGRPRQIFGTVQDITERRLSEAEQSKLRQQLNQAQKMEAIGGLAGGIAHDFNNILNVINGYSEILLGSGTLDEAARQRLQHILLAGQRAAALTRQLLAFSRKQVLQPKLISLNLIIEKLREMLRRLLGEEIEIAANLQPDLKAVKADPTQIEQVILNLSINARDAMPDGGTLTIETRNVNFDQFEAAQHPSVKAGPYVRLSITDTGTGMDQELMSHIFEPFFTTKGPEQGTGLGLATVYGIVRQSGGDISVSSEPGHGSSFSVYLPACVEERETVQPVGPQTIARGTETILLVEDDAPLRKMTRTILEGSGYTVLEANDGEDAMQVAERYQGTIDLLLTDVSLPKIKGPTMSGMLKQQRPGVRVLFVSGYANAAISECVLLKSGTAFLQKPFSAQELTHKIREVLDAKAHVV